VENDLLRSSGKKCSFSTCARHTCFISLFFLTPRGEKRPWENVEKEKRTHFLINRSQNLKIQSCFFRIFV